MITALELARRVDALMPQLVADLGALVRIPSVSSSSFDQATLDVTADGVASLFAKAGLETSVTSVEGPDGVAGRPAVIGRKDAAGTAPTVLLYAHHDVQPPGAETDWHSNPFEPTERGGRLYGRGVADDKAGIIGHLGALLALGEDRPVGVRVFIEGEEEVGSPSFGNFLATHRDELQADVTVVLDSCNWKVGTPGLTTMLRGLVEARVTVSLGDKALHSGMFGGPILDAPTLMCRLIATLHDAAGNVAVPGLLEAEAPLVEYPEADFRADSGLYEQTQLVGSGPLTHRLWTKPALSVIGMDVTPVAGRSNTIHPSCTAALSLRIAPGDEPARAYEALAAHLKEHAPFGARVEVEVGELGPAFLAPAHGAARELMECALKEAWGTEPVAVGIGGSIPFIADLQSQFPGTEVLVTAVLDPESAAHAPNESVHLGDLRCAILAEALFLASLGGILAP